MELWVGAFGEVGWIFESLNAGTTDRKLSHTLVTEDEGKIVAAVDVFIREMRDEHGRPVKVGGIGSVATLPDHRQKGHSGRLLQESIRLMEREGCAWSLLFTGLHGHYGRYGWVVTPWRMRVGAGLRTRARSNAHDIAALGNQGPWPMGQLAQIYATFNALRPLSHVRTDLYWDIPIRVRLERPNARTWIARAGQRVLGYLVANLQESGLEIVEIGFRPGAEESVPELLDAALAGTQGEVSIQLPSDPVIDAYLDEMFERITWGELGYIMSRPIAPDWSIERIRAMTDLPNAHHWSLDSF